MQTKATSIYHNFDNTFEKVPKPEKTKEWVSNENECTDGTYRFGMSILCALNYYGVLNKSVLLKHLDKNNDNNWKKTMIPRVLKSMRAAGVIDMYRINNPADREHDLTFYILTEKGKEVLKSKDIALIPGRIKEPSEEGISNCLRTLALNQWHVNLTTILGKRIKASFYRAFSLKKGGIVPSMVKYATLNQNAKNEAVLSLFTYIAPYEDKEYLSLMQQIVYTYEFLTEHQNYRPAIVIILCEDAKHASYTSWKLNHIKEMRPLDTIIYALDMFTNKERMMSFLYSCETTEEGIVRNSINLE